MILSGSNSPSPDTTKGTFSEGTLTPSDSRQSLTSSTTSNNNSGTSTPLLPIDTELFSYNANTNTLSTLRTITDHDVDTIKQYWCENEARIRNKNVTIDLTNNTFSEKTVNQLEEMALVNNGFGINQLKSNIDLQNSNFLTHLKETAFQEILKQNSQQDLLEAAKAIAYINKNCIEQVKTDSTLPPNIKTELSKSRQEVDKYLSENPEIAFRLYVWFYQNHQKIEAHYQTTTNTCQQERQNRWKEIRREAFLAKLNVLSDLTTGGREESVQRPNTTLEAVLLPYSVCIAADQVYFHIQQGDTIDEARAKALSATVEGYREVYEAASEVIQENPLISNSLTPKKLAATTFIGLQTYGNEAPFHQPKESAGRRVYTRFFNYYFSPFVEDDLNQSIFERLNIIKKRPDSIPYASKTNDANSLIELAVQFGTYPPTFCLDLNDFTAPNVAYQQEMLEKHGSAFKVSQQSFHAFKNQLQRFVNQWFGGNWEFYSSHTQERKALKNLLTQIERENQPLDFHSQMRLQGYVRATMEILANAPIQKKQLEELLKNQIVLPDNTSYDAAIIAYYYGTTNIEALKNIDKLPHSDTGTFEQWITIFSQLDNATLAQTVVQEFFDKSTSIRVNTPSAKKLAAIEHYYKAMIYGNKTSLYLDLSIRPFNITLVREFLEQHSEIRRIKLNDSFSKEDIVAIVKKLAEGRHLPRIDFNGNPNIDETTRTEIYGILAKDRVSSIKELSQEMCETPNNIELKNKQGLYHREHQLLSLRKELVMLQNNLVIKDQEIAIFIQELDEHIEIESKPVNTARLDELITCANALMKAHNQNLENWWQKQQILTPPPPRSKDDKKNIAKIILFIYRGYFLEEHNSIPPELHQTLQAFIPNDTLKYSAFDCNLNSETSHELHQWFLKNRSKIEKWDDTKKTNPDLPSYYPRWQQVILEEFSKSFQRRGTEKSNAEDNDKITRPFNTGGLDTVLVPYEMLDLMQNMYQKVQNQLQTLIQISPNKDKEILAHQAFLEITAENFKAITRFILHRLTAKIEQSSIPLYEALVSSLKPFFCSNSTIKDKAETQVLSSCAGLFQSIVENTRDFLAEDKFTQNLFISLYTIHLQQAMSEQQTPKELVQYLKNIQQTNIVIQKKAVANDEDESDLSQVDEEVEPTVISPLLSASTNSSNFTDNSAILFETSTLCPGRLIEQKSAVGISYNKSLNTIDNAKIANIFLPPQPKQVPQLSFLEKISAYIRSYLPSLSSFSFWNAPKVLLPHPATVRNIIYVDLSNKPKKISSSTYATLNADLQIINKERTNAALTPQLVQPNSQNANITPEAPPKVTRNILSNSSAFNSFGKNNSSVSKESKALLNAMNDGPV